MKPASLAELTQISFSRLDGRAGFTFNVDGFRYRASALYHNPPGLRPDVWEACLQELALSCLVDVATAGMAKKVQTHGFGPGRYGKLMFRSAAEALRLETVADNAQSLSRVAVQIEAEGRAKSINTGIQSSDSRVLVLMGGGKDSLYTYDLLRRAGYDVQCFYVTEARRTWQQLRRVYGALNSDVTQHRMFLNINQRSVLDRKFRQNYASQFQIGQIIAASLPYAIANKCRYIALGLERSSDIPMLSYRGRMVNHQHQKSRAFIRLLNKYFAWRFRGSIQIISPVYSMYDLGIYARFIRSDVSLLKLQSSCGGANSYRRHCGQCDKCAFLALLLAGLSGDRRLYNLLFPVDPLQNAKLLRQWLGAGDNRPLTCAGLKEEARIALHLLRARNWPCAFLRSAEDHSNAVIAKDARNFLAVHDNPLVPEIMQQRIRPLLDFPAETLLALLGES